MFGDLAVISGAATAAFSLVFGLATPYKVTRIGIPLVGLIAAVAGQVYANNETREINYRILWPEEETPR